MTDDTNTAGLPGAQELCECCKTAPAVQQCERCGAHICRSCWTKRDSITMKVSFCYRCVDMGPALDLPMPKRSVA